MGNGYLFGVSTTDDGFDPASTGEGFGEEVRPFIVLVTGDRKGFNKASILRRLMQFPEGTILVHGDAPGVDTIAGVVGTVLGFDVRPYPADWARYKRGAGPIRNRHMFNTEKPDLVIAFHHNYAESKGTRDMVDYARSKGCPTELIKDAPLNLLRND
jgi:hypothetical protein